jgi:myo-inositol-1(or 4)-monophosphatase
MEDLGPFDKYLRVAEEAVRTGGRVIQEWVGRVEIREKGPADLVTQADLAAQEAVRKTIAAAFPDHGLLGEESPPSERSKPSSGFRWIVDPLDGTTNFVHGVPHYCVSLALEHQGRLLVGAVYDPTLNECFTAAEGRGARLNGRPIYTSGIETLRDALAAVGFPPNADLTTPDVMLFMSMIGRCQSMRRTGSAALNLAYMAAGRYDAFWSFSTHVWDVAAGVLIVREAGGFVTSPSGGEFHLDDAHFLAAANRNLHAQVLQVVSEAVRQV